MIPCDILSLFNQELISSSYVLVHIDSAFTVLVNLSGSDEIVEDNHRICVDQCLSKQIVAYILDSPIFIASIVFRVGIGPKKYVHLKHCQDFEKPFSSKSTILGLYNKGGYFSSLVLSKAVDQINDHFSKKVEAEYLHSRPAVIQKLTTHVLNDELMAKY